MKKCFGWYIGEHTVDFADKDRKWTANRLKECKLCRDRRECKKETIRLHS